MKYSLIILLFSFFVACKPAAEKPATEASTTEEKTEKTGPEYTSAYICPMHCKGSGSDKPGICPACGMDYVLNDKDKDGHDHEGHDHGDHEGHNH